MRNKIFVLMIIILLPLAVGLVAGYQIGHKGAGDSFDAEFGQKGALASASHASYEPEQGSGRDSISGGLFTQRRNAITRVVAEASPAVVGINVIEMREYQNPWSQMLGDDPFFRQFFGPRIYRQPIKSLGSGFIISPDGYIVTNDHVAGNATEITVTMTSKESYKAKLVGTDPTSDVALLKIDGKDLPSLRLGNSDDVIIGEWVIAMGNPFGLFDISDKPTVTVGVVSASGVNLQVEEGRSYRGMIQTDAAINNGNSGGPLINSAGDVIGMNSVIVTPNRGSIGLGFAIPISRVKKVVTELRQSGKVRRSLTTGLELQTVDTHIAHYFGLTKAEGVLVSDVQRGSPAEHSGFKPGDIILEVNGERISSEDDYLGILNDAKAGDVLVCKILREKKPMELRVKLEGSPS
jgi:serine protease Do